MPNFINDEWTEENDRRYSREFEYKAKEHLEEVYGAKRGRRRKYSYSEAREDENVEWER